MAAGKGANYESEAAIRHAFNVLSGWLMTESDFLILALERL
jgi:hypothetical protein